MLKILKHVKSEIIPIIIITILLIVQAVSELSLPDYTSNIVNVGIQQNGIENAVPSVIREQTMSGLLNYIDDKEIVLDKYKLIEKNNLSEQELNEYIENYPILEEENIYELKDISNDEINQLNDIFTVSIAKFLSNTNSEISSVLAGYQEDNNNVPETLITQAAVEFIKNEYKEIGINLEKTQTNYIILAGLQMLGIAFASMLASIVVTLFASRISAKICMKLRKDIFEKVVNFSNAEFTKFSTASLITRSTNDIQQIQLLIFMLFRIVIYSPLLGIGGIIKVLGTNNNMAWVIAVAVFAIIVLVLILFSIAMPKFKKLQELIDKINLIAREFLTGLSVIKAFNTQKHEEERFDKANTNLTKTNLFLSRVMTIMMPTMMIIMNLITILIVWVGASNINDGYMQVGDLMAFIQYTIQIVMSFLMLSMVSIMLPRAAVSVKRIAEVLNEEIVINDPVNPKKIDTDKKGYLEFKNVTFKYPDAQEDVITDINFVAKPGETTAIIGSTGSGKSTIVKLIPRFYDVTKGEILIDGVNIKDITQHDLRERLGYVPQKGLLFSGTIESNIKYGDKEISDQEMIKAAQIAQAEEFIEQKEDKYNSEISQGGTNVSGGQKQRLSIARAVAKNPEIYIFDDSFSALDYKTDAKLRKALQEQTKNATVIIVAQRINTVLQADQIIVLKEGKIVGKGTHKELMKNCNEYKQIALSQLSKEELENE